MSDGTNAIREKLQDDILALAKTSSAMMYYIDRILATLQKLDDPDPVNPWLR